MSLQCPKCKIQNRNNAKFCSKCGTPLKSLENKAVTVNRKILGNRYVIEHPVKSGGMGAIYRAKHIKLDEVCAIKEMTFTSTDPKQNQYAMKRFYEEAKLLSRLRHPNLPVVTDYFDENNKYYIVMDFVEGEDLETTLRRDGKPGLAEEKVIEWIKEVLYVLDYLHSQTPPVIYRDIKPSNIMVRNKDKKVMLVDFGIAKALQGNIYSPQTAIGTFGYAPIEQYRGKVEPRSDLYALGATIHYLLTGAAPTSCQPDPVRKLVPSATEAIEKIIEKAMEEKADDRFSSAKDMLKALEGIKKKSPVKQSPAQGTYTYKNLPSDKIVHPKKVKTDLKNKKCYREVIKDKEAVKEIKNIINEWGNRESWFAKDFGDKIDIARVSIENAFLISSEVLYMERRVKEGSEPCSDLRDRKFTYEEPSYKSLKDFPVLSPPQNFTTTLDEHYIFEKSREISKCSRCLGAGEVTCRRCKGKGLSTKTRKIQEPSSGGQEKCRYCSGDGKSACDLCNGYKEIIKYTYFETRYYPMYFKNTIYNGKMDKNNFHDTSGTLIYEEEVFNRKKSNSFDQDKTGVLQESCFKEHFNSLMAEVSTYYKDTKRLLNIPLKIKFSIEEIIIREVNFRDKKKLNTIWLYGTGEKKDRVVLENRPLLWTTGDIIGGVRSIFMGKNQS